jgi:hypothetical protein
MDILTAVISCTAYTTVWVSQQRVTAPIKLSTAIWQHIRAYANFTEQLKQENLPT